MVKRKSSQTEDDDLLLNRQPTDDREEEDYDVADLSSIPAPKIEFIMPNLTPLEGAKKQPLKKKSSKALSTPPSSSGETLTSEQLNMEVGEWSELLSKTLGGGPAMSCSCDPYIFSLSTQENSLIIVHLRPVVRKAQNFLAQRLVRKMKRLEKLLEERETDAVKRKVARFEEEIHFLRV
ncbi:unnamed protein product [Cylicostephanus goldi]|uniref:Uncharacterized protein n=1 Tax=Cylicostephanus goldi TaxID=71465 RepID=A0A3P6QZI2_CYLGO|nr:unnamed protein product [Cylicostephanus goldi]